MATLRRCSDPAAYTIVWRDEAGIDPRRTRPVRLPDADRRHGSSISFGEGTHQQLGRCWGRTCAIAGRMGHPLRGMGAQRARRLRRSATTTIGIAAAIRWSSAMVPGCWELFVPAWVPARSMNMPFALPTVTRFRRPTLCLHCRGAAALSLRGGRPFHLHLGRRLWIEARPRYQAPDQAHHDL